MAQAYVLLDRDGVINYDSAAYIKSAAEWRPLPGSLEAIALFNQHGYQVVVITNQSGLGRGLYDEAALTAMHNKMRRLAQAKGGRIAAIYYCPHLAADNCQCRKPKPGLLRDFASAKQTTLRGIYFIGDSLADIQTAEAVGAKPILVRTGKGATTLNNHPDINCPIFDTLYDAAKFITQ